MSLLTNVGAGLFAASGAMAWISPAATFDSYGLKNADVSALYNMRALGAWQLCLAAVLVAGKEAVATAAGLGLFSAAAAILMNIAVWEYFSRPKGSQVGTMLVFLLLGRYSLMGSVSAWVSPCVYLLVGGLIHATPVTTGKLYELAKPMSDLAHSMLALSGSTILTAGVYLASLAYGLAQPQSFAAAFLCNAFFSLKWAVTEAAGLNAPKAGPLAWAAISAVLSALALK